MGFDSEFSINDSTIYMGEKTVLKIEGKKIELESASCGEASQFSIRYNTRELYEISDKKATNRNIYVARIILYHDKTRKIVYVSPWSMYTDPSKGYTVSYDSKQRIIAINWDGRSIAVLSEDELNKDSTLDLRKFVTQTELIRETTQKENEELQPSIVHESDTKQDLKLLWLPQPPGGIFCVRDSSTGKDSPILAMNNYQHLAVELPDRYKEYSRFTLIQLCLINEKNNRFVYVTPWALVEENINSYKSSCDVQKNTITITWGERVIAILSLEDLMKEDAKDYKDTAFKHFDDIINTPKSEMKK